MFWFFPRFCAYFLLQTLQYILAGAQKYIFTPGAWYPSYATDKITRVGLVQGIVALDLK